MEQNQTENIDLKREFLRHTVATLAYRGGKAIGDAPDGFANFKVGDKTRTPIEILKHIGDLIKWARLLAQGPFTWEEIPPQPWDGEVKRFFEELKQLDDYLASETSLGNPPEKIFQGPIADSLHHVGQIGMLRRLAGSPVRGENYFKAEIVTGRVGPEQSEKRAEFD